MNIQKKLIGLFAVFALGIFSQSYGMGSTYVVRDGVTIDRRYLATKSMDWHFEQGREAFNAHRWKEAAKQFKIVVSNFPATSCAHETYFYLGASYYYLDEYDYANEAFSAYLTAASQPIYFEDAVRYKFSIAEELRCGALRRFFCSRFSPKWANGTDLALSIYDEVIAALPCHGIAAESLFSKGCLLLSIKQYRESVDAFRTLIRRFPKHELVPESYLMITQVYLDQSEVEAQNPDLLSLAEVNVRRFKEEFPRDDRVCIAEGNILLIKERFAKSLYDMGQFYERTGNPKAAIIYYQSTIDRFPETTIVSYCQDRLDVLMGMELAE